jgi:hypothetical protein
MQFKLDKNGLLSWMLLALTGAAASWISLLHGEFSWLYPLPPLVAVLLLAEQRQRAQSMYPLLWPACLAVSALALVAALTATVLTFVG